MSLWSDDQSKVFGYLQFLLSVQGAQAVHPSQEDPVGEKQHHQVLGNKTVPNIESALFAQAPSYFTGKWSCRP